MIAKKQRPLVSAQGEVWHIVRAQRGLVWSGLRQKDVWSCFVSLCQGQCPGLMLMFCEVTSVQQENNPAAW